MSSQQFPTPVLFLIFNRPDTTKIVFEKIKLLKPRYLFISADGPRQNKPADRKLCEESRSIINEIDWDCELKTNFKENNLGCKIGVSSGIDWFFSNVDEGIILEDDCLPDISFFNFCETLLLHFRDNERIMHISGVNFQDGVNRGDGSYYFSRHAHVWGWATWKKAWKKYDVNIIDFREAVKQNIGESFYPDKKMRTIFFRDFERVFLNKKDTWDHQWVYTIMTNNGLSVIPNKNLVSNLGFDKNATHTNFLVHPLAGRNTEKIEDIVHPSFIIPDYEADIYTFKKYMYPNKFRKLIQIIKNKI